MCKAGEMRQEISTAPHFTSEHLTCHFTRGRCCFNSSFLENPTKLLTVLEQHIANIDMICNAKKSVWMIFEPKDRAKIINVSFPQFSIAGNFLQFVKVFKYLGHVITDTLSDEDDLQREIRSLFTRIFNIVRLFAKCSSVVKIASFKAYCICLYDAGLWSRYKFGSFNKLSSSYNKYMKLFFGYKRRDSVTQIVFDLALPSFNTIVHSSKTALSLSWSNSCNAIVNHVHSLLAL